MKLLKKLCSIHAPSGEENNISEFIIEYVNSNMQNWKVEPKIYCGDGFQDSIILSFGKPKTAIYTHMDSIGFTVKYNNEIIKIGGPVVKSGTELVGSDSKGKIEVNEKLQKIVSVGAFDSRYPLTISSGNPNLQPYEAVNLDLAYEHYYAEGSYFAVNYFRKEIDNFDQVQHRERR